MIKKGFNFFTSEGVILEMAYVKKSVCCCSICTSPFLNLCKPFCKYRNAIIKEYIEEAMIGSDSK